MNLDQDLESEDKDRRQEDIRAAYQVAVQMISYEGQKRWSSTSVFIQLSITIAAGSLVPAFIPGLGAGASALISLILSILGFFATVLWLIFLFRYERITYYWILCARELEEHMTTTIQSFQRGKSFARGKIVRVSAENVGYQWYEHLSERWGLHAVYFVFGIIFLCLIAMNAYRFCYSTTILPAAY